MVVNTVDVKPDKHESTFSTLRKIEAMQQTEDILKTGMLGRAELGITSIMKKDGAWRVSEDNKGAYKFDGIERNLKFDIRMYETGFVLSTGREGTNILGMTFDSYLSRMGRRKVYFAPKDSAKVFPSLKSLKTFIENHTAAMGELVKKYGYEWKKLKNEPEKRQTLLKTMLDEQVISKEAMVEMYFDKMIQIHIIPPRFLLSILSFSRKVHKQNIIAL